MKAADRLAERLEDRGEATTERAVACLVAHDDWCPQCPDHWNAEPETDRAEWRTQHAIDCAALRREWDGVP